jgi:diaminopimelate epimerase
MQLKFVKMHGLGNDFMIAEWPEGLSLPDRETAAGWADRHTGVGFDQLLILEPAPASRMAARYYVFNADGRRVEQCGNGLRCIASYLSDGAAARLELTGDAGVVDAEVLEDGRVRVNLGEPRFEPGSLPFAADRPLERYRLGLASGDVEFGIASMGNPHAVVEVDSVDRAPVGIIGAELSVHRSFPQGVNVGFMLIDDEAHVRLRVYERGVGETRACGTGAAAAVAVGRRWGRLAETVDVELPGGTLTVDWPGPGEPLRQTGPATRVYEGLIES